MLLCRCLSATNEEFTACEAATVKPESATACSIIFSGEAAGAKAGSQELHQKHLEEIREVATIGLTHICNHKHVPLLEAQLQVRVPDHPSAGKAHAWHVQVRCVQRWLLASEATLEEIQTLPPHVRDLASKLKSTTDSMKLNKERMVKNK